MSSAMVSSSRAASLALTAILSLTACSRTTRVGPPTANAGYGFTIPKRTVIALDGTRSTPGAHDGTPLTFAWRQTSGAPVVISDPALATPYFVSPGLSGLLTFELVVAGEQASKPATVAFDVENRPPVAWAGPDLAFRAGWLASVSALGSVDPDGDPLTYTWLQTAGPPVTLDALLPGVVQFTVPDVQGALSFLVEVSDGEDSSTDDVQISVYPPGANHPPAANAGSDVNTLFGWTVMLYGSGWDPDGFPLTFSWAQTSGPTVALQGAFTSTVSFVAPAVECDIELELTVSDGVDVATDRAVVHVGSPAPIIASLDILPAHPRTEDDLVAKVVASTPGITAPPSLSFAWTVDGAAVPGQTGDTLPAALTARGEVVAVRVTAVEGVHQTTRDASVTIEDTPPLPVLPVAEIPHGSPYSGLVTVFDPDGDQIPAGPMALAYGPAGMSVAPDGVLTWTPTQPMFDRSVDVHYGVAVGGAAPLAGTLRVVDPSREQAMRRAGFQIPASAEAIRVRDLDGDGTDDLLIAGGAGVQVVQFNGTGYAVTWMNPYANGGWSGAVEVLDVDGDGVAEIFYGTRQGLARFDGVTRRETGWTAAGPSEQFYACEAGDLDRDGQLELVCLSRAGSASDARVRVIDPITLETRWMSDSLPLGASLAIGDVDDDPALEIVTSGGYVFDGVSHALEWRYNPGFGNLVGIGRVQAGGSVEIVGSGPLRGFSAKLRSPLWEYAPVDGPFLLRDVDGDGVDEVMAVKDHLQVLDYVGGAGGFSALWTGPDGPYQTPRSLAAGDLDGDGQLEVVWDQGGWDSGPDSLIVGGLLSAQPTIEWQNANPIEIDGPMLGGELARTGPGETRLVFESPAADSFAGMRIVMLDPASGLLSTSAEIGLQWQETQGIAVADADGDGLDEVFVPVGTWWHQDDTFAAWSPATGSFTWTAPALTSYDMAVATRAADLNSDGHPDLVGITGNGVIWVWDVFNQALIWKSIGFGWVRSVEIADLDGSGRPEIVVGNGSRIMIYRWSDPAGLFLEVASVAKDHYDLAVGDCDGDGVPEVYALGERTYDGAKVTVFDTSLAEIRRFTVPPYTSSLHVEDLGTPRKNLAVAFPSVGPYDSGSDPWVFAVIDPVTGIEIWRSPALVGAVYQDSAHWYPWGGRWHLALGTGRSMTVTR